MALVSTGQFTIVDNNDARTISSVIVSNVSRQQVFTKDESTAAYTPNFVTSPHLVLTPKVYIGGLTEANVWGALSGKKFCLTVDGAAITNADTNTSFVADDGVTVITANNLYAVVHNTGSASTLTIKGNVLDTVAAINIFFQATYTDNVTGLTTPIIVQEIVSTIKTGTNAVYIVLRGQTNIEQAVTGTKNNIAISADLLRASGTVDITNLSYKWFDNAGQISTSTTGYATKYGFKTVASGLPTAAAGTSELNVSVPVAGAGNDKNTIVISETAVANIGVYRVEITDNISKTYTQYFTVSDYSDPYSVRINSVGGDKLQNGIGSTSLTPQVFKGATALTTAELTNYIFTWRFYDKNGKRGLFIDNSRMNTAGGAPITANTATTITFTYGSQVTFSAGDVVKVVDSNQAAYFYEVVSSATGNVVTIKGAPLTHNSGWLSLTDFPLPAASALLNGKLYVCSSTVLGAGTKTTTGATATLPLTGDEIDGKSTITCEADRP